MNAIATTLIFLLYAVLSGSGLIVIKLAVTGAKFDYAGIINLLLNKMFIGGFALYVLGFLSWIFILSKFKLNIAFPIGMSLFFIASSLGSYFILKENFSVNVVTGTLICLLGIIVIAIK